MIIYVKHGTRIVESTCSIFPQGPTCTILFRAAGIFFRNYLLPLKKKYSGTYMEVGLWEEVTFNITARGSCMKRWDCVRSCVKLRNHSNREYESHTHHHKPQYKVLVERRAIMNVKNLKYSSNHGWIFELYRTSCHAANLVAVTTVIRRTIKCCHRLHRIFNKLFNHSMIFLRLPYTLRVP